MKIKLNLLFLEKDLTLSQYYRGINHYYSASCGHICFVLYIHISSSEFSLVQKNDRDPNLSD